MSQTSIFRRLASKPFVAILDGVRLGMWGSLDLAIEACKRKPGTQIRRDGVLMALVIYGGITAWAIYEDDNGHIIYGGTGRRSSKS